MAAQCLLTAYSMPAQQVIALIESLSAVTPAALDPAKQEADTQQALSLLAPQQPLNLELHAKLAKVALQAGATTAALQAATALIRAALPQGRSAQDVVEASDAPGVAAGDWQWLAVASYVLGQVSLTTPVNDPRSLNLITISVASPADVLPLRAHGAVALLSVCCSVLQHVTGYRAIACCQVQPAWQPDIPIVP